MEQRLSEVSPRSETSKNHGIFQLRYAFLELPQDAAQAPGRPRGRPLGVALRARPSSKAVPADLSSGLHRDALELANRAKLTKASARRTTAGHRDRRGPVRGGGNQGQNRGELSARRRTLLRLVARAGVALTENDRARIQGCADAATLDRWIDNAFGANAAADVLT